MALTRGLIGLLFLLLFARASAMDSGMDSGVVHWKDLKARSEGKAQVRHIMSGGGRDFQHLVLFAETLPGYGRSEVRHEDVEELLIVKEGELKISVAGKSKVMGPGSVAIAFPGERRSVENTGATPGTFYSMLYRARLPVNLARGNKAGGSFLVDWDDVEYVKSDIGGRRDFFRRPTSMFSNFEMHVSTLNEGLTNHAVHTHAAEEFVLMLKGDVVMRVGENNVNASAGDVVFLASMIPHSLNNAGTGETIYFAFQFWE